MMRGWFKIGVIGALVLLTAGCSPFPPSEQLPTAGDGIVSPAPATPMEATPMEQSTPLPLSSRLQSLIDQSKADLAERLSVPLDQISLVEAEAVVWPDASLGCPQPGMVYAQVLTPGYLILLDAENKEYEYHASRGAQLIFCENPSPPVPGSPGDT